MPHIRYGAMDAPHATPKAPTARLIDSAELADWLGVSPRQVRRWVEGGTIPVTRLDRRVRFDVVAIEKWLKRQTAGAA
jgi:excisionase family DNA binding protein